MPRQFNGFTSPVPKTREARLEEGINIAFGQGQAARRKGKPISANPYMESQEELHQAFVCGWEEG
jgi:hypothetical protein